MPPPQRARTAIASDQMNVNHHQQPHEGHAEFSFPAFHLQLTNAFDDSLMTPVAMENLALGAKRVVTLRLELGHA
jgi:hypothetical protein